MCHVRQSKLVIISVMLLVSTVFVMSAFTEETVKPVKPEKLMLYSGEQWNLQLYGFLKLDVVYNTEDVAHEAGTLFVVDKTTLTGDQKSSSLVFSVRSSRIGLKLGAPSFVGAKTTLVFEMDFWGQMPNSTTAARQGSFRIRHGFVHMLWNSGTYARVGQYWTAFMPMKLIPDTVSFLPLVTSGWLFMREPQLTVGQIIGSKDMNLDITLSIARTQAGNDTGADLFPGPRDSQTDNLGPGEASGIPAFRGGLFFTMKPGDLIVMFGANGEYQREKQPIDATTAETSHSYGVIGSAKIVYSLVSLGGYFFYGSNLDTFFGQGTWTDGATEVNEIKSMGGWGQLSVDLRKIKIPIKINGGYGIEDVDEDTADAANNARVENSTIFGNVWAYYGRHYQAGFEVARHSTKYLGNGTSNEMRYHFGFKLSF